jgi:hypothetical protein
MSWHLQWKEIPPKVSPNTIPGVDQIMIFRRPMISMNFNAKSVKRKLVPEIINPTAVGWLKPISLKRVAE